MIRRIDESRAMAGGETSLKTLWRGDWLQLGDEVPAHVSNESLSPTLRLRPARVRAIGEADVADADLLAFAGHGRVAVRVFRTERGVEARRHLPTLRFRRGSFGSEPSPVRRRHRAAWRYFRLLVPSTHA